MELRMKFPQFVLLLFFMIFMNILVPSLTFAGWQVARPEAAIPSNPFFQAGVEENRAFMSNAYGANAFPNQYASLGQPAPVYAVSVSGSIKQNIQRIMGRYHWRVVW